MTRRKGHFPLQPTLLLALLLAAAGAVVWELDPWQLRSNPDSAPNVAVAQASVARQETITALGRIEPKDGVLRVSGPSLPAVVLAKLEVDDGDEIKTGDVIAILDTFDSHAAAVERIAVELAHARSEHQRHEQLFEDGIVSTSLREDWQRKVEVLEADLKRAVAERDLRIVRSPITGRVLKVHTREGERVGADGIAELGRTGEMYAIAEVYETDVCRVRVGQRATVTSPAFDGPVHGTVVEVGSKIGKMDVLDTDPAARTDARVVEVEIQLEEPERVANLTNLQVDVTIEPRTAAPSGERPRTIPR